MTPEEKKRIADDLAAGRRGLQALARVIEDDNPNADPMVKSMALNKLQKLIAKVDNLSAALPDE